MKKNHGIMPLGLFFILQGCSFEIPEPPQLTFLEHTPKFVDQCSKATIFSPGYRVSLASLKLKMLVQMLPKGGDLNRDLAGSVSAQQYIDIAKEAKSCYNIVTHKLKVPPCDFANQPFTNIIGIRQKNFENALSLNASSERSVKAIYEHYYAALSGRHDFYKMYPLAVFSQAVKNTMLARYSYAEFAVPIWDNGIENLVRKLTRAYPANDIDYKSEVVFSKILNFLLGKEIMFLVNRQSIKLYQLGKIAKKNISCKQSYFGENCNFDFRFLLQVDRDKTPADFITNAVLAYFLAQRNPLVAGVSVMGKEKSYFARHYFTLQNRIIDFLKRRYPMVHLSVQVGNLRPCFVNNDNKELYQQIANTLDLEPDRTGSLLSLSYLDKQKTYYLASVITKKSVSVELSPQKDGRTLGTLQTNQALFSFFKKTKQKVSLVNLSSGVLHQDSISPFLFSILSYHLFWKDIVHLTRMSLQNSFLPGPSLWKDDEMLSFTDACRKDSIISDYLSKSCKHFLRSSKKALVQWMHEKRLLDYSQKYKKSLITELRKASMTIKISQYP